MQPYRFRELEIIPEKALPTGFGVGVRFLDVSICPPLEQRSI